MAHLIVSFGLTWAVEIRPSHKPWKPTITILPGARSEMRAWALQGLAAMIGPSEADKSIIAIG
jgi:hypothetical protein